MTIKFFANYDTSETLLKRFFANYSIWYDDLKFTIAEDFNFTIVFNSTDELINPGAKIITVIQEPSWSKAHGNTALLTGSDYIIIHDQGVFESTLNIKLGGKVIESLTYMFYHFRVDKTFFHYSASTKKVKKLSMIIFYINKPVGIYQKRGLLIKILNSDLDIYGWILVIDNQLFECFIDYKFTGLLVYEYSISIENSEEKNYITEKFVDFVFCNKIPIYRCSPDIDEIYDYRFFRDIESLKSLMILNRSLQTQSCILLKIKRFLQIL